MSDPYTSPALYGFHTLDLVRCPGLSMIMGDGERLEEFQDMQVPLTSGATTTFRFEPNGKVRYGVKLWNATFFAAWKTWVAMLMEGKNRRPRPRVYALGDARLEDVGMSSVSFMGIGPRQIKRGDATIVEVTYKEVRRQKPYGGVALVDKNETFKRLSEGLAADTKATNEERARQATARAARARK